MKSFLTLNWLGLVDVYMVVVILGIEVVLVVSEILCAFAI